MHLYVPPWLGCNELILSADENSSFCRMVTKLSAPFDVNFFADLSSFIGPLLKAISSLYQWNVNGKSPVPTTHWTLTRSPTFTSFANSNGVIFGGTLTWHSIFGSNNFFLFWCNLILMVHWYFVQCLVQFVFRMCVWGAWKNWWFGAKFALKLVKMW